MKSKVNSIQYRNMEDMLAEQNAEDRGRYFLCDCPDCKKHEAFIYKNNPKMIVCNRENECGEKFFVEYKTKSTAKEMKRKHLEISFPELTNKQVEALDWSNRVLEYFSKYESSDALDNGYRGLSRDLVRNHVVDLKYKEVVNMFFHKTQSLFKKDYRDNDFMMERNIILPIYGDDGIPERLLLRSSINPDASPKEIQLVLNPSKETRDFFIDVPEQAETVVITEALFDGLSFREIDEGVGFISLTGATKTRKLGSYLKENMELFKDKNILFAFDDDNAGRKALLYLTDVIEEDHIGADWNVFHYPEPIKDPNEFLEHDKERFRNHYQNSISHFQNRSVCREHLIEMEV